MTSRISSVLSATALVVALLGSTPLGEAARQKIPPLAKHAKTAGFATNAGAVNGLKASRLPRPGRLVPLGADGKFAASVGQVGPAGLTGPAGAQGPKGDTGAQGVPGLSAVQIVVTNSVNNGVGGLKETTATCPSGKKIIGGGAQPVSSPAFYAAGYPVGDNAFKAIGNSDPGPAFSVRAFAICATVAG
jgi:hypothetical protein